MIMKRPSRVDTSSSWRETSLGSCARPRSTPKLSARLATSLLTEPTVTSGANHLVRSATQPKQTLLKEVTTAITSVMTLATILMELEIARVVTRCAATAKIQTTGSIAIGATRLEEWHTMKTSAEAQ